ncbi:hypothetical protein FRC98_13790 [Lujinxingia vulgaris]|uniref:Uncharacterized protein n=1 Tax=Lujinxingia vulgaris TaxID=2600176 RepID=A0A5C6X7G0_9DELT|nr:hypothetical protein [Lujinxingia vulgaris]TXD36190.1 hypothetical protein FRC98_13790 [Lujinxingia vulgaris]
MIVPNPGDDLDVGDLLDVPDAPLPDVSVDTGDATPAPTCDDGVQNGEETGIDCGGADCEACEPGQGCEGAGDCASGLCQDNVCVGAGCEGVSCDEGQACYRGQCYAACDESAECGAEERCFEGACTALSCDDVICGVAETCYRGVCYAACQDDSGCSEESAECVEGSCVVPTCDDGVQNGDESDVDCGGSSCEACEVGQQCGADADCGEALAQPWGDCQFEEGDVCTQAGVQTRMVEIFSCGEDGVCASEEIEEGQQCERVTEAEVCADEIFGEWSSCEALEGAEADLCTYEGERRRTVTSFACASESCEPTEREEVESCVRETDAVECGDTITGEWSSCEAVDGASVCALEGERRRGITTYSCAEGGCQETNNEEVESCALETDDLECGAEEVGEWGPCVGFDGTCSQTGTQTRVITSYACGSGECVPSEREETQSCSRDQGGVQCQEPDYGAWSECGGFADECALEGSRTRTVTYYECAADDSCAPREEVETGSCTRDTTGTSCGAGVTYGDWSTCDYATECSLNGERTRSVVTRTCAGGSCESVTTTETDTTACVRETAGTSCGEGVTRGDWSASCEYATECSLEGTRTRSVVTRTCAGGSCEAVTTSETEVRADCARDTADVECGDTTYSDWGSCGGFADECDETGTQTRTATDRTCAGGVCTSVDRTETQSCTRDTDGDTCGAGVTYGDWSECGGFDNVCDESGERSRSVVTRTCAGSSCESVTTTETESCLRDTDDVSCGDTAYTSWGSCGGFADECDTTGTQTRTATDRICDNGGCTSVDRTETQSCTRVTDGDTCGAGVTEGPWSACGGFANACDESGERSRSVVTRTCAGGTCESVTTTETESCTRVTDGDSCGNSTYTSWTACGGFANTCDTTGTQTRTRTDYNCSSSGTCTTSTATETQSCTRDTDGTNCGADQFTYWSACGGFDNVCDETGTQTRTRTEFDCSGGSCTSSNFTETQSCTRDTDGDTCGSTTYGNWGSCGGFTGACDSTGTQSRTATDRKCSNGTCSTVNRTETQSCTRSVTGNSCGTSTYTSWGSCGGYSSTCDTTGTQSRTRTDYNCNSSGTCTTSTATETQGCTRVTNGNSCGSDSFSTWSACGGFANSCDETGTQTRTRTEYDCSGGSCSSSNFTETQSCSRDTDGDTCGSTTYGSWGSCGGFSSACDRTGTQSRTATDRKCSNGTCSTVNRTETQSCTRSVTGNSCGTSTYTGWGSCGGYANTCDTTGTQSRTRTDYKCNSSGTCTTSTATETQGCTRSTNGNSCGTTVYGTYSACGGYSNSCDETGTKSRSVTTYSCSSGNCSSSTTTQTVGCSRNTDGKSCGTTSCGTWGMCMVNYGTCSGTQSRSCTDYKCSNGSCSTTTRTESQSCNANFGMNCTADNGWSGCCDFNGYCEPQGRPGEPQRICML